MCTGLVLLGDANIERVLADPPLIWRVVAPDDPDAYEMARAAAAKPSFLGRLFGRNRRAAATDLVTEPPEMETTDLDKAWHGIHYLLTGTAGEGASPLHFIASGGRDVGDEEIGIGPARVFRSDEVVRIRDALVKVDDVQLRARFDPAEMTRQDVYPDIWSRDPEDDNALGYVMEYVAVLRAFVDKAVAARVGLVVYLT